MTKQEYLNTVLLTEDRGWLDHSDIREIASKAWDASKESLEAEYTEEMRKLNKEWKENLKTQRKMLIDKAWKECSLILQEYGLVKDFESRFKHALKEG